MKIGITGDRGFIGTNLKKHLRDHELVTLWEKENVTGELPPNFGRINNLFYEFNECDIIVHLAGKNKGTDEEIIKTNVTGSLNLINMCLKNKKPIILAGSDYKAESAYKDSKDAVKALCKSYGHLGLSSCVMDFPKVIGPGCRPYYNSFVTTLIYAAATNQLKALEKQIKNLDEEIELIHVYDLCESILCLIGDMSRLSTYTNYIFTKYDGLFKITFREIVQILNGDESHKYSDLFIDLLHWYKENDIYAKNK